MIKIFNSTLPNPYRCLGAPDPKELDGIISYKYADLDFIRNKTHPYIKYALNFMPIYGNHKRVLVDIKLQKLVKGQYTCVPGWHLDGSVNKKGLPKTEEVFSLFVFGNARTEFPAVPIKINVDPLWDFASLSHYGAEQIDPGVPTMTIPNCWFVTYGTSDFHRGVQAKEDETRLLIRSTETDVIEPRNEKLYQ